MHPRLAALTRVAVIAALCVLGGAARVDAANCSISTTPIVFGVYNVFTIAPIDSTGSVVYRCNGNPNVLITISSGQNGTFSPRAMTKTSGGGTDKMAYNLYLDAARTTVWGDYSSGTSAFVDNSPQNNREQEATIYGRIPAQQDVSAGSYADTVTITLNF